MARAKKPTQSKSKAVTKKPAASKLEPTHPSWVDMIKVSSSSYPPLRYCEAQTFPHVISRVALWRFIFWFSLPSCDIYSPGSIVGMHYCTPRGCPEWCFAATNQEVSEATFTSRRRLLRTTFPDLWRRSTTLNLTLPRFHYSQELFREVPKKISSYSPRVNIPFPVQ